MVSQIHSSELVLCFSLLQLAVIVAAARAAGSAAVRLGQSRVVGEIIIGLLLGPSLMGLLAPGMFGFVFEASALNEGARHDVKAGISMLSQLGLVLLMFQIGMEFEFQQLAGTAQKRAVLWVAALGLLVPFGLGLGLGMVSAPALAPQVPMKLGYVLFMATAMSITAVPVLGRIMLELNLTRTPLGVVTITAAAINDVVGWILLAMITALTVSAYSPATTVLQLAAFAAYAASCWWLVRPLLKRYVRHHANDAELPQTVLAVLIALIFVSAICTYLIGIFAIFGGFMVGVLLHDEPTVVAAWRAKVSDLVSVLFLPIFFTCTGLRTSIGGLGAAEWGWCAIFVALAFAAKFGGSYLGARIAGMDATRARCVGIMMNTRGLMELIVLNVGYDLGVIPPQVFTILVIMAVLSTAITMPLLRRWLPKSPDADKSGALQPNS